MRQRVPRRDVLIASPGGARLVEPKVGATCRCNIALQFAPRVLEDLIRAALRETLVRFWARIGNTDAH